MMKESRCTNAAKNEAIIAKSMTKRLVERDKHRAMRVTPVARQTVSDDSCLITKVYTDQQVGLRDRESRICQ